MGSCCCTDRSDAPFKPEASLLETTPEPQFPHPDSSISYAPSKRKTPIHKDSQCSPVRALSKPKGESTRGHRKSEQMQRASLTPRDHTTLKKLRCPIETLYSLGKVLHKDPLTTVCIAKHIQTGRDRVLKKVKKSKSTAKSESHAADQLNREVDTLSRLDHPNILKLYELYEDKLYYYFISEALTGGYLMDYLAMERNLSERLAAKIMKQVLKALAYCHSKGVLHGNLSMDSLILQSAPTDGNVHVVVLGIGSVCLQLDRERLRGKSSFYVAPETLRNAQTEKTDVWSCGVILHLLLCGNPPFNGPTSDSILEQVADESNVTFPQELWDGVSAEAINLLRGMLVKDPSARISVTECLNHPWIKAKSKCAGTDSKHVLPALRNLKMFKAKTSLKHIILSFIAEHVDVEEETKALKEAFLSVDVNGDGSLSKEELVSAYCQIMSKDEAMFVVEKVMRDVDFDGNGFVEYSEFMLAAKTHKLLVTPRNLRTIFKLFDKDGSGNISFREFTETLSHQGLQSEDEVWTALLAEVDSDGDGKLDFKEFSRVLLAAMDMEQPRK